MTAKSIGAVARKVGGLTAISRIFGFLRDIALAVFLGAGPLADAFLAALKLPNMFRRMSAEGAMTNAFLPQFSVQRSQNGKAAALSLAAEIQIYLVIVLAVIVVLMELCMPVILAVLAPGFASTPDRLAAAIDLARITMPYLPMISLVALWTAIANAENRFAVGAAMPIILNICLILAAASIPLMNQLGIANRALPLAVAVSLAGIIQMLVMRWHLRQHDIAPVFRLSGVTAAGRAMWKRFVPAAFGAAGMQLNTLVDLILASLLQVGAISWLYFADRVAQLPLGIVGIALGVALLPRLSRAWADNNHDDMQRALREAIILGAFFVLPAVTAMVILAESIIGGLFGYGAFSVTDIAQASRALAVYALGLPAFVMIKILQAAFYASDRPGLVLRVSLIMVACNIGGSLLLMGPLGHVGLAMATSGAATIAALILMVILIGEGRLRFGRLGPLTKIVVATAIMAAGLLATLAFLPPLPAAFALAILVVVGGGLFAGTAVLLRAIPAGLLRG